MTETQAITILNNFTAMFKAMLPFLSYVAVVFGIWMFYKALMNFRELGQPGQNRQGILGGLFVQLFIASLMVSMPWMISQLQISMFGSADISGFGNIAPIIGYAGLSNEIMVTTVVNTVGFMLAVVGYIATFRGLYLFYLLGSPDTQGMGAFERSKMFNKAVWHIIGGQMALNIGAVARVVLSLFGVTGV